MRAFIGSVVNFVKERRWASLSLTIVIILLTLLASGIYSDSEVGKQIADRTWLHWWALVAEVMVPTVLLVIAAVVKEYAEKLNDDEADSALQEAHARATEANSANRTLTDKLFDLGRQYREMVKLAAQINRVLAGKRADVEKLENKDYTGRDLLNALVSIEQANRILLLIYAYFRDDYPGSRMRLALYRHNPATNSLESVYSFDGEGTCITRIYSLTDPGPQSEVVKIYGDASIKAEGVVKVIPNTEDPNANVHFQDSRQQTFIKGLLVYRHTFVSTSGLEYYVLSLDCDTTDYFQLVLSDQYRQFLIEMMRRIEYELLVNEAYAKLP